MKKTIHDYEPEEVIEQEVQELMQGECDPFDVVNFVNGATDALVDLKNTQPLEEALRQCDTAEIGRIVMEAVENHYYSLAEFFANQRYENHQLDHKYER